MSGVMLSTIDNPYNPTKEFDKWFSFDVDNGYNSCGLLARIVRTNDEMTEDEEQKEIERAIDEIIKFDPFNVYIKVTGKD